ncbi:MAG: glycosyltransferase [Actinomycetota bacterium]
MRILVFAYACEPGKGSEPGAGWMWSRMLARIGETWVVTRANNRDAIEAEIGSVPEADNLRFVYVDLPRWARFWKRGQRGVRLYYLLWQVAALLKARRLGRQGRFDLVWHLTMANVWLGSVAPLAGRPFVLGPVGGGVAPPMRLLGILGPRGVAYELGRFISRTVGRYLNPLSRLAWRRASLILVNNPETRNWVPKRHRDKCAVLPHAIIEDAYFSARHPTRARSSEPIALLAGRILPWKGAALALRALVELPEWRLIVCGTGPDEARVRRVAHRLGVYDRTIFLGAVDRDQLIDVMRDRADILLHPSLHDDAPFVVVEALAAGLGVVCLDRGGPPVLGGSSVPISTPGATARALAEEARRSEGRRVVLAPTLDSRLIELKGLLADADLFRESVPEVSRI